MRELTLDKLPGRVLAEMDLETAFRASRCVIAAERLLLFRKLHGRELTAAEIGRRTKIHRKHCEPLLDFLVHLGLLQKRGKRYRNAPLADRHFIKERSIDWSRFWSKECIRDYEALTVMEEAITSGRDWRTILGRERKSDYELVREDREWAREFTLALYDCDKPDAEILARSLDLSHHHSLLDVGGGSGVTSIALVRAHPHLKACILDFEFVCETAKKIIRRERLSRRIKTLVGDMDSALPRGYDVLMFWNIGHIDTRVMKMAYRSLPAGGMVVRSCPPPSRTDRLPPDAFFLGYTAVRPGGQGKPDIIRSLEEAGFGSVKYRRLDRGLGMITGFRK